MDEICRSWRALADQYAGRVLIGEVGLADPLRGQPVGAAAARAGVPLASGPLEAGTEG